MVEVSQGISQLVGIAEEGGVGEGLLVVLELEGLLVGACVGRGGRFEGTNIIHNCLPSITTSSYLSVCLSL